MKLINKFKIVASFVVALAASSLLMFVPFSLAADPVNQVELGACMAAHPDQTQAWCEACIPAGTCDGSLTERIISYINVFLLILGIIAIIMIIFGGFKYLTSAGDEKKVVAAKNTILYAVIGLIIASIAGVIVNFVIKNA